MNRTEAKAWLKQRYGTRQQYEESANSEISISQILEVLSHIPLIACGSRADKQTREVFLFDACARLDRWRIPTPFVVTSEYRPDFRKCAMLLSDYESSPTNSPVFLLHALRDELYEEFSEAPLPLAAEKIEKLEKLSKRVANLPRPLLASKLSEFESELAIVLSIVDGLRDGTLCTILRTSIPFAISAEQIDLKTRHRGIGLAGSLVSEFSSATGTFVSGGDGAVLAEMNTTRWPGGVTAVELRFSSLIDPSIEAPALRIPSGSGRPRDSWPNGFNVAFNVIYEVCWHVRSRESESFGWIPSPSDVGRLESRMSCRANEDFGLIIRTNPASLLKAFVPTSERFVIEGEMLPTPWHRKCRELAQQYARVGDMREALFWLNVGTEALISERMKAQVTKAGSPISLESLEGKEAYWDDARALVSEVSKEVADKIEWPSNKQKPSRFKQLKYVCKYAEGAPSSTDAQSNYAKVSKHRNALFHGENDLPVSADVVIVATSGYDWLDQHFFPED
jgi:hypothetical protein